jgi:Saxitoxin biosynthesis operon protein SxtJ
MKKKVTTNQLRSFGYTVGGVLAIIGLWPTLLQNKGPRIGAVILAGVLQSMAVIVPRSLSGAYRGWMIVGHCLGWVNTRVILCVIFYAVFTPLGLIIRLLGQDPMNSKLDPSALTYRVLHRSRLPSHMGHQF